MRKIFCLLLSFALLACREPIIHNLGELDANRLLSRLTEAGIMAEKTLQADGNWSLSVERSAGAQAIKLINDSRIARPASGRINNNSSMLASREAQRREYEQSISQEIEATLSSLKGVLEARVHLNLPAVDPLFGKILSDQAAGSGSVLLITAEAAVVSAEEIKKLVAGAAGIKPEAIAVILNIENQVPAEVSTVQNNNLQGTEGVADKISSQAQLQIGLVLLMLGLVGIYYWHSAKNKKIGAPYAN